MLAGLAAIVLGLPIGLYVLLTRGQRRTTREIRSAAVRQGWRYRRRRWQGNPTAFRIDGRTPGGLPWVMTSGNSRGDDRGWSVQLAMRFPSLGGEPDLAVLPREGQGPAIPPNSESRIAAFSEAFAGIAAFLRDAREAPSGVPEIRWRLPDSGVATPDRPAAHRTGVCSAPAALARRRHRAAFLTRLAGFLGLRVSAPIAGAPKLGDRIGVRRPRRRIGRARATAGEIDRSTRVHRPRHRPVSEINRRPFSANAKRTAAHGHLVAPYDQLHLTGSADSMAPRRASRKHRTSR